MKKATIAALVLLVAGTVSAAPPRDVVRPKDKDLAKTGQTNGQGQLGAANAKGMREAYVNGIYNKLQDRRLAEILQEVVLKPEKVENDPAAMKGVERFIDLIKKHESAGRTPDQAVEMALAELRPDLKLTKEDLLEACK